MITILLIIAILIIVVIIVAIDICVCVDIVGSLAWEPSDRQTENLRGSRVRPDRTVRG